MDSYDSNSSNEGFESPSTGIDPFNDPNYKSYKRGQQFLIVNYTAN